MSGGHRHRRLQASSFQRTRGQSRHSGRDRRGSHDYTTDSILSPIPASSPARHRTASGGNRNRGQAEHRRSEAGDTSRRASTIENRNVYTTAEPRKKAKQNRPWYKKAGRWLGKTVFKGLNLIGKVEGGRDVPVGRLVEDEYENPSSHECKHSRRHRGRSGAR